MWILLLLINLEERLLQTSESNVFRSVCRLHQLKSLKLGKLLHFLRHLWMDRVVYLLLSLALGVAFIETWTLELPLFICDVPVINVVGADVQVGVVLVSRNYN